MDFQSYSPKRLVGLVTGAGEYTSAPWPRPNRSVVTKATREHSDKGREIFRVSDGEVIGVMHADEAWAFVNDELDRIAYWNHAAKCAP